MQRNKHEYSIDFINRDVKDFPAIETREKNPCGNCENIALIVAFALIILAFLGLLFSGSPKADCL